MKLLFGDTGIKQASDGVLVYTFLLILLLREVSTHIHVHTNAILNKQRKNNTLHMAQLLK